MILQPQPPSAMPFRSQHKACCAQSGRMESPRASVADWIHGMLKCEFFSTCPRHRDQKKAEVSALGFSMPQLFVPRSCWPLLLCKEVSTAF